MTSYTVQAAKTHLSRILREVADGGEVIIVRGSEPVARLVPVGAPPARRFGVMDLEIPAGFDAPLTEEELAQWE